MMPVRDYVIMELVDLITDKPDWESKVFNESIVAKWRSEILNTSEAAPSSASELTTTITDDGSPNLPNPESTSSQQSVRQGRSDVSPKMFDWIIAELKYKAELFNQLSCVEALDGVWKSDTLISAELQKALVRAVRPLEDVPEVGFSCNSSFRKLCLCTAFRYPTRSRNSQELVRSSLIQQFCFTPIYSWYLSNLLFACFNPYELVKAADIAATNRLIRTGIPDPTVKY